MGTVSLQTQIDILNFLKSVASWQQDTRAGGTNRTRATAT